MEVTSGEQGELPYIPVSEGQCRDISNDWFQIRLVSKKRITQDLRDQVIVSYPDENEACLRVSIPGRTIYKRILPGKVTDHQVKIPKDGELLLQIKKDPAVNWKEEYDNTD